MDQESLRLQVVRELRLLRRLPGPLDEAKLSNTPLILRGLGGHDQQLAKQRLLSLANEFDDDRDIQAAFATMDGRLTDDTLLMRLSSYGDWQGKDQRTIRRWSDIGLDKLASLIISVTPWIQPKIRQALVLKGDTLHIGLDMRIPALVKMDIPELWVDGSALEIRMPPIERKPDTQRVTGHLIPLANVENLPITVRLLWRGEKNCTYESITQGAESIYFSSRIYFTSMKTSVKPVNKLP